MREYYCKANEAPKKLEDITMSVGDLCRLVCQEYRSNTLEAKNCEGLDCELCQLKKQSEISYKIALKKVGEWLEGQRVASEDFMPKGQNKYIITAKELADFRAGKMPAMQPNCDETTVRSNLKSS